MLFPSKEEVKKLLAQYGKDSAEKVGEFTKSLKEAMN